MKLALSVDHEILPIYLEDIDESLSALRRARTIGDVRKAIKGVARSSARVGAATIQRKADAAMQSIADAARIDASVIAEIFDLTESIACEARDAATFLGIDFHGSAVTLIEGDDSRPWWRFW